MSRKRPEMDANASVRTEIRQGEMLRSLILVCIYWLQPPFAAAVAQCLGRQTYFDKFENQHLSGAGYSIAGSISRDLNSQKLHH